MSSTAECPQLKGLKPFTHAFLAGYLEWEAGRPA
jgi:hypothetical protein